MSLFLLLRILVLPILLLLTPTVHAIFRDEASTDFHHALLGLPARNSTSNTFFHAPYLTLGSKAALLYTLSEKGILGAVNPKDGGIVWRQVIADSTSPTPIGTTVLRRVEGGDTVAALVQGRVTAWSGADGKLAWEYDGAEDGAVSAGSIVDIEIPDMPVEGTTGTSRDAIVLAASPAVVAQRLDGTSGAVKWTYMDDSGSIPYRIAASATHIFVISYHKRGSGLSVKVTTLDPVTGQKIEEHTLSTEGDLSKPEDIVFVGSNSPAHILAWTDQSKSQLKINVLGTSKITPFDMQTSHGQVAGVHIHAPTKNHASPKFLAHYETAQGSNLAEIFHIDLNTQAVTRALELPVSNGKVAYTATTVDANVYFTRVLDGLMTLYTDSSQLVLGSWRLESFQTPGSAESPYPVHAAAEVVARDASTSSVRSAVLLSSGEWVLLHNNKKSWSRPEYLVGIVKAAWAPTLPHPELEEALKTEVSRDPVSAYIHRVIRHLGDLSAATSWLMSILPTLLGSVTSIGATTDMTPAQKAYFGFDKIIFAATENGRIVALDSGNQGRVIFNVKAVDLAVNEKWDSKKANAVLAKLFNMPDVSRLLEATASGSETLPASQWESLLGEAAAEPASAVQDALRSDAIVYTVHDDGSLAGTKGNQLLWTFRPRSGEVLKDIHAAQTDEPIASIGKVLGDRRVLYKYLSPNTVLATATNAARNELSIHLLDAVSGTLLHSATNPNVDTTRPITAVLTENWFAYSFTTDTPHSTKGFNLIVAELLASSLPNERGLLSTNTTSSSTSATLAPPSIISMSLLIPYEVSAMSVTQTLQGITNRELLLSLSHPSSAIVALPRYATDPRRLTTRDPTRLEAEIEGLTRYAPFLDFDPKWYLTHSRDVLGVRKIVTEPGLLESTSLVLAVGELDIWAGRVAPSFAFDVLGAGFGKWQLVLTVVALTIGTVGVAPVVGRKGVDLLWKGAS